MRVAGARQRDAPLLHLRYTDGSASSLLNKSHLLAQIHGDGHVETSYASILHIPFVKLECDDFTPILTNHEITTPGMLDVITHEMQIYESQPTFRDGGTWVVKPCQCSKSLVAHRSCLERSQCCAFPEHLGVVGVIKRHYFGEGFGYMSATRGNAEMDGAAEVEVGTETLNAASSTSDRAGTHSRNFGERRQLPDWRWSAAPLGNTPNNPALKVDRDARKLSCCRKAPCSQDIHTSTLCITRTTFVHQICPCHAPTATPRP